MMRHIMMGGFGHHGMMGGMGMGLGMWMMHRMLRRVMMYIVIGGLVFLVAALWLRVKTAERNHF